MPFVKMASYRRKRNPWYSMNKVLIPKQSDGKTETEEDDRERWRHFKVMPMEEAR